MAKKNTIIAISVVASLAAGYLAGAYFGIPGFPNEELAGSVNKARLSNSGKTDPEVLAAMELLQNDAQTQARVSASTLLLASRVSQMNDLAKSTAELSSNIESLKSVNEYMTSLSKRTANAVTAFEDFSAEIVKVMNGEKSSDYEQASNNAILAFTVLESNISSCTECVWALTNYLKSNKNDALAQATCKWMNFCAEDAVLNDSKQEMEKWAQVFQDLSSSNLGTSYKNLTASYVRVFDKETVFNAVFDNIKDLKLSGYKILYAVICNTPILVPNYGLAALLQENNLTPEASNFLSSIIILNSNLQFGPIFSPCVDFVNVGGFINGVVKPETTISTP